MSLLYGHVVRPWEGRIDPVKLVTSLTAGLISGILTIVMVTAFSALIFSGPLSGFISHGISFILFGAFVIGAVTALTSSYAGTVARPHEIPAAILALIASIIAGKMPPSGSGHDVYITVVFIIIVTSISTGLFFLVLGFFKAGNLIRFIPYPVMGGFLAGTGYLLIKGAFGVMTEKTLTIANIFYMTHPDVLIKWAPGLILAVILFLVLRWRNHYLVMPAWLLFSVGLFYLVFFIGNTPLSGIRAQGWLIGPFQQGQLQHPLSLSAISSIDIAEAVSQASRVGTILIISCMSLLLNASGLEFIVREDIDLNRELRSVGLANLLAGMGGGTVGFHSLSLSALGYTMGAKSRLIGLVSAALCGSILFFGSSLLSYFPKPVMGAVLLFLGLSFLYQWLYETWFKLPAIDCVLILIILVVIAVFGFLQGVGVGMLVAVMIFVFRYSHVKVVKHALTGTNYHSNVDRPAGQQRIISEKGGEIYIMKLQGFIFFGTANDLFEQVKKRANDGALPPLRFLVLDFQFVNGVDSSTTNSFIKMKLNAESRGYVLIFTHLSTRLSMQLKRRGFDLEKTGYFATFPDLDRGMEWCEDQILEVEKATPAVQDQTLAEQLRDFFPPPDGVDRFLGYLERKKAPGGHTLIQQGDPPHSLYFLESGQVTVQLRNEYSQSIRLRTMGPGTVVGELGLYLRTNSAASVITERESVFYRLTAEALKNIEEKEPEIAAAFHKYMAQRLGRRLLYTNQSLQAMMD